MSPTARGSSQSAGGGEEGERVAQQHRHLRTFRQRIGWWEERRWEAWVRLAVRVSRGPQDVAQVNLKAVVFLRRRYYKKYGRKLYFIHISSLINSPKNDLSINL